MDRNQNSLTIKISLDGKRFFLVRGEKIESDGEWVRIKNPFILLRTQGGKIKKIKSPPLSFRKSACILVGYRKN